MAAMRSPAMPTSARNHGAPVPSTTRPLVMSTSNALAARAVQRRRSRWRVLARASAPPAQHHTLAQQRLAYIGMATQSYVESLDGCRASQSCGRWRRAPITGPALYVTRGVLDQTVTANGVVRFAMLPPWQALLGFICLAALVARRHRSSQRAARHDHGERGRGSRELVLPLFALIVLLLPFLPVLPDRWPVLQALAGPLAPSCGCRWRRCRCGCCGSRA